MIEHFALLKKKIQPGEKHLPIDYFQSIVYKRIDASLRRQSDFMQQDVFNTITSETEMMRYIHKLSDKDYGLTHGMIPLGSCTMKLNSAIAMLPITFPGFCNIHPFAPADQTRGYQKMIDELE